MNGADFNITAYVRIISLSFFLIFFNSNSYSQEKISGVILDNKNSPIEGATISIKNSNRATLSNSNGNFSITAKNGDTMIISSVGMEEIQIQLFNQSFITITMSFKASSLDEVLVVGYGTTKRKDVTGAVTRITAEDFNTGALTNPLQQIQGKVAGLVIVQPGGDPNGDFTVRIRGATSLEGQPPLLVIDGIAIDDFHKSFASLNPADIASYDILKDASAAAIYGARGANGVILVTTKQGKAGKPLIDYNGFIGMEKVSNQLNLLSADEWRNATASMNAGGLDFGGNMDWQKTISQTGILHSHTIGISGGNDQINFRGSIGYHKQKGVIINSGKENITTRLTAVHKSFKNKLVTKYSVNTSTITRDLLPDQQSTSQSRTSGAFVFGQSLTYLPVWPAYKPDGSYALAPSNILNPLFLLKELYSKKKENFFQGSIKADYELLKDLNVGMLGTLSRGNDIYDAFWPGIPGTNGTGQAFKINNNKQTFSGDIHGHYQKKIHKHAIDITGVYEYNQYINDGFGVTARGYLFPYLLNNNLVAATNVQPNDLSSFKDEEKLISFLGRTVYNYDDRYIITANFRRDGSSKFGINNRWGNFPSLAVAWRVSNEEFLNKIKWLNNLKLRVSYGFTGNQENLPPNAYQLLYGPSGPYLNNNQVLQGYSVLQENNPDLKWEVRKSFNVGIDFSIFEDRINGSIDVFNDKTSDMLFLYDLPQPPFLTNKVYANAATAFNKGVEVTIGAAVIKNKNISWTAQFNIATLNNSVTNLLGEFKQATLSLSNRHYGYAFGGGFGGTYVTQLEIGYPAGVFWIPEHAGINSNGQELFNNYDVSGKFIGVSEKYTDKDRVYIDPTPDFTWGFTNHFEYKNWELSFLWRGVQRQKIFANSLLRLENINYLPGTNVTKQALTNGFTSLPQPSTYWLRDGSFTRLENITLRYELPTQKLMHKISFYLAATNLFVITNYEGIDPEVRTEGSQRYIDLDYYPKTKGFMIGVNVGF
jgi:TonB-dependent starch-binding outer membrane protein SusC